MARTQWDMVGLVFLGGLLAAGQFAKISLVLEDVAQAFGRDLASVSVLVSMVGVIGLVAGAMAGAVVAAIGAGRTFLIGLILGAVISLGQALMPAFGLFAVSRGLEGVAHLALVVAGPPLMAAAANDRDRPLVMGLWAVFFGLTMVIAAVVFPPLMAAGGLPLLFGAHGLALGVLAAALAGRLPKGPIKPLVLNPIAMHAAIYGRLRSVAPALGFVGYTFLFLACLTFFPLALGEPGLAATLPLASLATTLIGGALCRYFPPHHVAAAGFLGTIAGFLGLAAGVPGALHVGFALMGIIPGASFAAIPHLNPRPEDRARATGAIAQLGNLGTVTGTPVFALLLGAGVSGLIAASVAISLIGLVLAFWAGHAASGTPAGDVVDVP